MLLVRKVMMSPDSYNYLMCCICEESNKLRRGDLVGYVDIEAYSWLSSSAPWLGVLLVDASFVNKLHCSEYC